MKILESQNMTIREAVRYAYTMGVNISYGQLQGILNKVTVRNNTFIIPGTFTKYLRFNKAKRGCLVEKIEMFFK